MDNTENNNNESRVKRFFKSIIDAVSFAKDNKDKSPKVGKDAASDYYVSYILNSNSNE